MNMSIENPARLYNEDISQDALFGTVSYMSGGRRYGTVIASEADRFVEEFAGAFAGDYDSMVAFVNTAAEYGGILSGFDLEDFVSEDSVADLLTDLELFIPAHVHITINPDGTLAVD